jgi:hypothetical protein
MIIEHSKKMGRGLLVYVMLELTVLVSTRVYAQVAGASLGTVTDASGAAVPTAVWPSRNGSHANPTRGLGGLLQRAELAAAGAHGPFPCRVGRTTLWALEKSS